MGGWGVTIGRAGHVTWILKDLFEKLSRRLNIRQAKKGTRIRSWNKMSWCGWSGSCSAGHTDLLTRWETRMITDISCGDNNDDHDEIELKKSE